MDLRIRRTAVGAGSRANATLTNRNKQNKAAISSASEAWEARNKNLKTLELPALRDLKLVLVGK